MALLGSVCVLVAGCGEDDSGEPGDLGPIVEPGGNLDPGESFDPSEVEIDVGNGFACRRLGPDVDCWGELWGEFTEPTQIDGNGRAATRLAAAYGAYCIIWDDGSGECELNDEQFVVPDVIDVAVLYAWIRPCFVLTDGGVVCRVGGAPLNEPVTKVSAGVGVVCGVSEDGSSSCWDAYGNVVTLNDAFDDVEQIAPGWPEVCVLGTDGVVECFDYDFADSNNPRFSPDGRTIPGIDSPIKIASGSISCALTSDRRVECWGENTNDLLTIVGLQDGEVANEPVEIPGLADVADISVSFDQACAITVRGDVTCWGNAATHFLPEP